MGTFFSSRFPLLRLLYNSVIGWAGKKWNNLIFHLSYCTHGMCSISWFYGKGRGINAAQLSWFD